jgi:hypothetical protein
MGRRMKKLLFVPVVLVASACTADVEILSEDVGATSGASIGSSTSELSGCRGQAATTIPADGRYVITTFGGPGDHQPMSCGGYANGTTWYAASRQRYGCRSRIKLTANGKCVVLQTDDYGPDVCVERAANMPIIDVSPLASKHLFGMSGAGWSDRKVVVVEEVPDNTPLGICSTSTGTGTGSGSGAGSGSGSGSGTTTLGSCNSATLGRAVPEGTCVQAASNSVWYQCNGTSWVTPVDVTAEEGPLGACTTMHPL